MNKLLTMINNKSPNNDDSNANIDDGINRYVDVKIKDDAYFYQSFLDLRSIK